MKIDDLLYRSLRPDDIPDAELNRRILEWRENAMKKRKFSKTAVAAAVFCVLAAGSVTAAAAYHYLKPSQVAEIISDNHALSKAFEGGDAIKINQVKRDGGYEVTLMGKVSGAGLNTCVSEEIGKELKKERMYTVLSVKRTDGLAMTDDEKKCISPLIHGVPWELANNAALDTLLHFFLLDGVCYELMECDDLEIFAGRGVQIGVVDSFGEENQAFVMDETTGIYSERPGYEGLNLLFDLPLDAAKADERAASRYLKQIKEKQDSADEGEENETVRGSQELRTYIKRLSTYMNADGKPKKDALFLQEHAKAVKGTKRILEMDGNGCVPLVDGDGESRGKQCVKDLKIGEPTILSYACADTLESLHMDVFTRNSDKTVTYEVYQPAK